jgi:vitamin B12 transporter
MKKIFALFILTTAMGISLVPAETLDSIRHYPMEEVVIQSSRLGNTRKNIPQKIEVITEEDILSVPNENLAEVIKRLTNTDIIQYPGTAATIGMRGFSPSAHSRSYTLLLIDGKPAGTTNLASIIPTNIERIEVIKGPYATLYGSDAMSGVLNIITKTIGQDLHGNLQVEGGTFDFYRMDGSLSGEILPSLRGGLHFSTMKQGKDYQIGNHNLLKMTDVEKLMLDKNSYGDTMNHSKYDLTHINTRLEWDINQRWNTHVDATYTFGKDIETPGNYWGSYGYSKKEIRRFNAYGTIERKGKLGVLSFNPYFTRENEPNYSDNTSAGFIDFESEISEYGFQCQQQLSFGAFKAVGGLDVGVYDYHSERFESAGTPTTPYKPDNRHTNGALFAQVSYHYERLDLNVGARYDRFDYHIEANEVLHAAASDNTYHTFNPSIGAQYRLFDGLTAHSSFGTAFSVPDAYKTAGSYDVAIDYGTYIWKQAYVGNPDLKPEKSHTTDLGLNYTAPNNTFHADITYFYTLHDDKIVEKSLTDGTKTYINANASTMDGMEFIANYDFGSLFERRFSLNLYTSWTYLFDANFSQTTKSSAGTDSTYNRDLLYVRKLNGNFGLSFRNQKGFSARLHARYNGSRLEKDSFSKLRTGILKTDYTTEGGYTASEKILKHPDYLLFDLSSQYTFQKRLSIGLTVSNLLDENYTDKDGYNMPGRQLKVNIGYSF